MQEKFDLVCIGGGPAGQKAAIQAAKCGKRAALIDVRERLGGASVHSGTVPSKMLQETSRFLRRVRAEGNRGLSVELPQKISILELLARNRQILHTEEDLAEEQAARNLVHVFRGKGKVLGPHLVEVTGPYNEKIQLQTEYIVLATGSRPHRPDSIPFEDQVIYDSDGVLTLRKLPGKLAVLGGGIIGCEYASIFANLGVEVHLIDPSDSILNWADREIALTLGDALQKLGLQIHTKDDIVEYRRTEDGVKIRTKQEKEILVDQVLISKGRQGNAEDLGLENVGLSASSRGTLKVNDEYQTDVPSIFAAGDIIGHPALSSTSMHQGMYIARYLFLGERPRFSRSQMPVAIWTVPEVAFIGSTEEELKAQGVDYGVGRSDFKENTRALMTGETRGLLKLLFERKSHKLLAVHMVSDRATELLSLGQTVVHLGGTVDYFFHHIFNYPTLSGVYKSAALDAINAHDMTPAAVK
ncbi:MAG: Si-specific NAD(P)(+) transhydrogenase [Leptospirales bacterium]|nr:Si-specific NAD(P)(+) transhydrogenase [Leptospirales bacterium]